MVELSKVGGYGIMTAPTFTDEELKQMASPSTSSFENLSRDLADALLKEREELNKLKDRIEKLEKKDEKK
jgi:BMFP domain-containing protein YqiC